MQPEAGGVARHAAMKRLIHRGSVWCCLAGLVLFFAGLLMADLLPPLSPHSSAGQIALHWRTNTDLRRFGLLLITFAGVMIAPFVAVTSAQMKRIEGATAPLSYLQLGTGFLLVVAFIVPGYLMEVEAFRSARAPSEVLLINDTAWILFVGMFPPFFFQCLAIAGACFLDQQQTIFPRWLGYLNVWVALIFVPAGLIYFFKTGPFAWNGIFPFWVALADIGVWFCAMAYALLRVPAET